MKNLERIVNFLPAYDKRDPNPRKNYGIGAMRCQMILKGEKGAVHFIFSTGMYLPEIHRTWLNRPEFAHHDPVEYMGFDVGYHSPIPQFEGQNICRNKCEWIDKPCYSDGSALLADEWMDIFIRKGSDEIWKMLEQKYEDYFAPKNSKKLKKKK